jgi:hypothetical protein
LQAAKVATQLDNIDFPFWPLMNVRFRRIRILDFLRGHKNWVFEKDLHQEFPVVYNLCIKLSQEG